MKTMWIAVAVAGLIMATGAAYAGSACCAAKGKEGTAVSACAKATAGLDLTAEQKAKIAEIEASCKSAGSSEEACAKAKTEIRDVLTDEQKVKFDAAWEAAPKKKGGCG